MPSREKLAEFTAWCANHISGDEKGEAQIFLDHLFQAFGWAGGLKEAGATLEMRLSRLFKIQTHQAAVGKCMESEVRFV
jgi:hypothetical protein